MGELENKIKECFKMGYSINKCKETIQSQVEIAEYYLHNIVDGIYKLEFSKLTKEEKEALKEKRREVVNQEEKELAEKVGTLVFEKAKNNESAKSPQEAMTQAVTMVSATFGLKRDKVVRLVKAYDDKLYLEYINNASFDANYLRGLAEKIINSDMPLYNAIKLPGYSMMLNYLRNNDPELLAKVYDVFASHSKQSIKAENNQEFDLKGDYKLENFRYLLEIIFEFRVPIPFITEFVNEHSDIFLKKANFVVSDDSLIELLSNYYDYDIKMAFNFYLQELNHNNNYLEYRINRFLNFTKKFEMVLEKDPAKALSFIALETNINLSSVKEKVKDHIGKNKYQFDQAELKKILKFAYKYALVDRKLADAIGIPGIYRARIASFYDFSENPDDQDLLQGLRYLGEYNQAIFLDDIKGRK